MPSWQGNQSLVNPTATFFFIWAFLHSISGCLDSRVPSRIVVLGRVESSLSNQPPSSPSYSLVSKSSFSFCLSICPWVACLLHFLSIHRACFRSMLCNVTRTTTTSIHEPLYLRLDTASKRQPTPQSQSINHYQFTTISLPNTTNHCRLSTVDDHSSPLLHFPSFLHSTPATITTSNSIE